MAKHILIKLGVGLLVLPGIVACATTTSIDVVPGESRVPIHTVYLVVHGGSSSDVDDDVRRALLHHGLSETEGTDDAIQNKNVDLVVKYDDHWRWDLTMYLQSIDIELFDSKTGSLIAESSWKNSAFHRFPNAEDVVDDLVNQTFEKINTK